MKDRIIRFLNDLDAELANVANGERLDLYHIGRSSLVWKYGFVATTEDVDVLLTPQGNQRLIDEAIRRFGHGTIKAKEHGLYLQGVPSALPPIAGSAYQRATEAEEKWVVIRLFHLEPHDLAVSKLKRFYPKDQEDIRQMCDLELLDANELERRTELAWWHTHEKDGDPDRDKAFASLRVVQKYLRDGEWS